MNNDNKIEKPSIELVTQAMIYTHPDTVISVIEDADLSLLEAYNVEHGFDSLQTAAQDVLDNMTETYNDYI